MTAVHAAVGGLMALLFAAAGGLGSWRWWRVEPSDWFWRRSTRMLFFCGWLGRLITGRRILDP